MSVRGASADATGPQMGRTELTVAPQAPLDAWDSRFLRLAEFVAQWSKDPNTKVGAVIVDGTHRIVSLGFNGFPRGVDDDERLRNRELKLKLMVHAEMNAILFAGRALDGC